MSISGKSEQNFFCPQVPSLPPFDSYIHANYAIYLPGDQVILDDRPPTEIGDLTWDAHGCDDQ